MPTKSVGRARPVEKPAESEARHLLGLADEIMLKVPDSAVVFSDWRERVHSLVGSVSENSFSDERELQQLSMELRSTWAFLAHSLTIPHLKSPPYGTQVHFASGAKTKHSYERLISPRHLEERCYSYRPTPSGWQSRHLLFRSGMAVMTSLLQNMRPEFIAWDRGRISLDFFGGYFESNRLLTLFSSPLFSSRRYADQKSFLTAIEENSSEIVVFEPVSYDWEMETLNLDRFLEALSRRSKQPSIIVVDTTIVGDTFPTEQFLSRLPGDPPPILVQFSSGLKLDQEGLELSNVGIASVFWSKNNQEQESRALTFVRKMRQSRKITGVGLSLDEIALLDVPWFLNRNRFKTHSKKVFENNHLLASALSKAVTAVEGVFSHISHPALDGRPQFAWSVAPFVVFHLREEFDTRENHDRITRHLIAESKKNNIDFVEGMSFGFRSHRFEIIRPREILHPNGKAKGVLKVAMGCRQGPVRDEIINLLTKLAVSKLLTR